MNNRLSLLLIGCIFPFLSFYAQKNMNLPPYYPTVKGITDYAVWQLVYPDSLLKADIAGEAVCTLRIDSLGIVRSKYIEATHPLFAKAAEDVIEGMREWQPAKKAGRDIDSTVVFHIPFNPDIYSDRIWRQQPGGLSARWTWQHRAHRRPCHEYLRVHPDAGQEEDSILRGGSGGTEDHGGRMPGGAGSAGA